MCCINMFINSCLIFKETKVCFPFQSHNDHSATAEVRSTSKNLGRGNITTQPKKNTVASLLAQFRGDKTVTSLHPELTIEPIYKNSVPTNENTNSESDFDQSSGGRRVSTYIDSEGRLQIKTVCESPEIRNLSERDSEEDTDHDNQEDGKF